ncbi:MAG TPA: SDR family NAD(P)-dependent oxidoreductase [Steroidobacteraceae bacterium]|nr:SDR family NAD(P)-dependent oxidoreductase [Steroidobacteraceae bacterium]
MSSTDCDRTPTGEPHAAERRRFLAEGVATGAGLLAALGVSLAQAQGSAGAKAGSPGSGSPGTGADRPGESQASQPAPLPDLHGRVAYITAASDGIGLGIARACSEAGMKVVIGYRNDRRLQAALPLFKPGNPGVLAIRHDVTDREGWKRLLSQVNREFGNLHLLVNNAGVKTLKSVGAASFEEWDNAVAVNFTAIHNGLAACLPHMLAHGEGAHIVTTASSGGLLAGGAGVYSATKIAAVGLMEALRVELQHTTVGTSAFCPGLVNTDNYPPGRNPFPNRSPDEPLPPFLANALSTGMDPLTAGRRVLNGVRHNDLFILTHPEYHAGVKERFDAMLASVPAETPPPARVQAERGILHCDIYEPEIAHRRRRRRSYTT